MARSVDCPTCGTAVPWTPASKWRPFCSERCKLIDLGEWAAERHVIPGNANDVTEEGAPDVADAAPPGRASRSGRDP